MYACGDSVSPNQNAMNLVENYMTEYLYSLLCRASNRAAWRGGPACKIDVNDLLHYLEEDDEVIFHRVKYLLEEHKKRAKADSKLDMQNSP